MDVSVNQLFKVALKDKFITWYAEQVNIDDENDVVDLRLSLIKPIHAHWLVQAHKEVSAQHTTITRGFFQTGIKHVMDNPDPDEHDTDLYISSSDSDI